MKWQSAIALVGLTTIVVGCMPAHLRKYQVQQEEIKPVSSVKNTLDAEVQEKAGNEPSPGLPDTSSEEIKVQKKGPQNYTLNAPYEKIWDSVLTVLVKHYNINIIDRQSGVVTTEWDTFYLDKNVYRNKVTILVSKGHLGKVDIQIYNNVEILGQKDLKPIWLPTNADHQETERIIFALSKFMDGNALH